MFHSTDKNSKTLTLVFILITILMTAAALFYTSSRPAERQAPPTIREFGRPANSDDLKITSSNGPIVNLSGKWMIVTLGSIPVVPADDWLEKPAEAYLHFESRDGQLVLTGYTGCNGFGGQVYVLENHLHTPELVSTQRGCSNESLARQELALLKTLNASGFWGAIQIKDERDVILGTEITGIIQLRKMQD